jgi:hypothetical protein
MHGRIGEQSCDRDPSPREDVGDEQRLNEKERVSAHRRCHRCALVVGHPRNIDDELLSEVDAGGNSWIFVDTSSGDFLDRKERGPRLASSCRPHRQ